MATSNRVFTGYGYRIVQRGAAVALAGVLSLGMAPTFAFADVTDAGASELTMLDASASSLQVGTTYSVPFTMVKADGTTSMSGRMLDSSATITPTADGVYTITMIVKAGSAYTFNGLTIGGVSATLVSQDDTQYVFTATGVAADLSQKVEIGFNYTVPSMNMTHSNSAYAVFDVSGATATDAGTGDAGAGSGGADAGSGSGSTGDAGDAGSTGDAESGSATGGDAGTSTGGESGAGDAGSTSGSGSDAGSATDPSASEEASGYQVGHTYEVPISFEQSGTDTQSMAAQYFGSTAYVRPRADGMFEVSFSTNRADYIGGITYNGAALAQDGDTFTVVIPASDSDVVLPLGMSIVPMQQLGAGDVTVDLHVGLSDPTDLGTDDAGAPSSESAVDGTAGAAGSASTGTPATGVTGATGTAASAAKAASALPATGDSAGAGVAGGIALGAAAVAAGAGAMMRRNRTAQECEQ